MEKQSTYSSGFLKILIAFAMIYAIIYLAKTGYAFGQWLHQVIN